MRPALWLLAAVVVTSCGPSVCPPPELKLPSAPTTVNWVEGQDATIPLELDGRPANFLLDTGFPRSELGPVLARNIDSSKMTAKFGGAQVGPINAGVLLFPLASDGLLGADVLHQLPMRWDARARAIEVFPAFEPDGAMTAAMDVVASTMCIGNSERGGPAGPYAMLLQADVDGHPATFILDTGSDATFLRSSIFNELTGRPTLANVPIGSAFAGVFLASATRARALSIGGVASPNALVLTGPAVDEQLDLLDSEFSRLSGRSIHVDGFLGWTFLREFDLQLTRGKSATEGRGAKLTRFDTQTHWQREFIGIGIIRAPSDDPPGIKVAGFFQPSPAEDAGVLAGDVITAVDGVQVTSDSEISSADQDVVLDLSRDGGTLSLTVPYGDLLPDPP